MQKKCIRDCYDMATSTFYKSGHFYTLEEGDAIAETNHFIDIGTKPIVRKELAALDPQLNKKTTKYLAKKYPAAAKKVDLRKKDAHRSLVYEIMKTRGVIESTEEEGKTAGEHMSEEKEKRLEDSRKR
jgi:hypothetical protein